MCSHEHVMLRHLERVCNLQCAWNLPSHIATADATATVTHASTSMPSPSTVPVAASCGRSKHLRCEWKGKYGTSCTCWAWGWNACSVYELLPTRTMGPGGHANQHEGIAQCPMLGKYHRTSFSLVQGIHSWLPLPEPDQQVRQLQLELVVGAIGENGLQENSGWDHTRMWVQSGQGCWFR